LLAGVFPAGGAGIAQIRVGDIDADGDLDIVSAAGGNNGLVLLIAGGGDYAAQTLALGPVPGGVAIADVTGDGIVDLVGLTRATAASRLGVFRGLGGGAFATPAVLTTVQNTPGRLELADVDQDGDLDALVPLQTLSTMMVVNNVGGAFNDGVGCATGDYFMEFNVANQSAGAIDPVLQLRTQFDAWRAGLVGKPDAELSVTEFSPPTSPVSAAGACVQTLVVNVRDWLEADIGVSPDRVSVFHAPGSAGRAEIGAVAANGDGSLSVTITSPFPEPSDTGSDLFAVRIEPNGPQSATNRAVTLMPSAGLARVPHADFDLDGLRTVQDIFAFLAAWFAQGPGADYDGSGTQGVPDIFAFLQQWFRGG